MAYRGVPARPVARHRLGSTLGVLTIVLVLAAVTILVLRAGGRRVISGQPTAPSGAPVPTERSDWTTLSNPVSGLSYQIPPTGWTTIPTAGAVGSVSLSQGARFGPYNCGSPARLYYRGLLGSGTSAQAAPDVLAGELARQAATDYYSSGQATPTVTVDAPRPVTAGGGQPGTGALVVAHANQTGDPCLATSGQVSVLVLQLSGRDAVLVVNGDVTGGPATPAPPAQDSLNKIMASAKPTSGG